MELLLKILLVLYLLQALLKFAVQAFVPYEKRIKKIEGYYSKEETHTFDNILLVLTIAFVALLIAVGFDAVNFATGLVVGMTLIQLYFHRYSTPLPKDMAPKGVFSPIKYISYAIQADPRKAWRELLIVVALSLPLLYMLMDDLL